MCIILCSCISWYKCIIGRALTFFDPKPLVKNSFCSCYIWVRIHNLHTVLLKGKGALESLKIEDKKEDQAGGNNMIPKAKCVDESILANTLRSLKHVWWFAYLWVVLCCYKVTLNNDVFFIMNCLSCCLFYSPWFSFWHHSVSYLKFWTNKRTNNNNNCMIYNNFNFSVPQSNFIFY